MALTTSQIKKFIDDQQNLADFKKLAFDVDTSINHVNYHLAESGVEEGLEWDLVAIAHTPTKPLKISMYSKTYEFLDLSLKDLDLLCKINALSVELHCKITWYGETDDSTPIVFSGESSIEILSQFNKIICCFSESSDYNIERYLLGDKYTGM
jgi:hypothetical protein